MVSSWRREAGSRSGVVVGGARWGRVDVDGEPVFAVPGVRARAGAVGEYNGKFMVNQMVLARRLGFTSAAHVRPDVPGSFFPPDARWQVTGIRLACL